MKIFDGIMKSLAMMLVLIGSSAFGAPKADETKPKEMPKPEQSQTEHSFEDLLVQGKYHFSDELVTTVEEDKVLDALIGVRTDFKDRLEDSAGRY